MVDLPASTLELGVAVASGADPDEGVLDAPPAAVMSKTAQLTPSVGGPMVVFKIAPFSYCES